MIGERRRLQCFHIWFSVIIHATIGERHRLQCFRIWFGVIVHAMISKRRRLQCFYYVVRIVHATFYTCALITEKNEP